MDTEMTIEELIAFLREYQRASFKRQEEIIAEIESIGFRCYVDDSDDFCLYIDKQ